MTTLPSVPSVVIVIAVMIAAVTDVWKFRIPNLLTLPLLVSGLIYHAAVGSWAGLGDSALGALFGFGILLLFYILGGMGAGDVKLMAGVGAWLGMPLTFYVFVASALAAGIYSIGLMIVGRGLGETLVNMQILWLRVSMFGRHLLPDGRIESEVKRDDRRKRLVPFAAMVALGIIATYLWIYKQGL